MCPPSPDALPGGYGGHPPKLRGSAICEGGWSRRRRSNPLFILTKDAVCHLTYTGLPAFA